MINNDRVLLVDQHPNLTLFNRDLKIVKQTPWSYGSIRNMSWSSILSSFIIINNEKEVFTMSKKILYQLKELKQLKNNIGGLVHVLIHHYF